jgi:hypothetical protein
LRHIALNLLGDEITGRARSTKYALARGNLLPSGVMLVEEILPDLKKHKATDEDLEALTLAHCQDQLTKTISLPYVPEDKRDELLASFLGKARHILFPSKPDKQAFPIPIKRRFRNLDEE